MTLTISGEWKQMISDFYKYLDTATPGDCDADRYYELKYGNRERVHAFAEKHNVDRVLLEKVAVHEFMLQDDESILRKLAYYKG